MCTHMCTHMCTRIERMERLESKLNAILPHKITKAAPHEQAADTTQSLYMDTDAQMVRSRLRGCVAWRSAWHAAWCVTFCLVHVCYMVHLCCMSPALYMHGSRGWGSSSVRTPLSLSLIRCAVPE